MQSKNPVYYEDRIAHLEEQKPMMVDNEVDGDNIQTFEKKKEIPPEEKWFLEQPVAFVRKRVKRTFAADSLSVPDAKVAKRNEKKLN